MKRTTRKYGIVFGAAALAILLVSTSTVVAQVNSETLMEQIDEYEQSITLSNFELENIENILDLEGFRDHFTSENFADFIKSDDLQNIIASDLFLNIYNTQAVQDFIQSDIFTDFYNSDEAQIFLSNYYDDDDQGLQINEFSNENILPLGYDEAININSMAINVLGDDPSILGLIFVAFVGLVIGILTWIPGAILYLLAGLGTGVYTFFDSLEYYLERGEPNPVANAALDFLIMLMFGFGMALIWPLYIAASLAWSYWNGGANTTQMTTEEQYSLMQEQVLGSSYIPASSK